MLQIISLYHCTETLRHIYIYILMYITFDGRPNCVSCTSFAFVASRIPSDVPITLSSCLLFVCCRSLCAYGFYAMYGPTYPTPSHPLSQTTPPPDLYHVSVHYNRSMHCIHGKHMYFALFCSILRGVFST